MKRIFSILLFSLIITVPVLAQIQYIPTTIHRFSVSAGGGVTLLYGDLTTKVIKPALRGNLDYNITPFVSAGIEGQYGTFAGGDENINSESQGLYSESRFLAVNANARVSLGQFMPVPKNKFSDVIGGIYLGAGVGIVSSEVKTIVTHFPGGAPVTGTISEEASDLVTPVNLGINIDLPVYRLSANFNLQYNITYGEALDGYDFEVGPNNDNDAYAFISVALRYHFGGIH